MNRIRPVRIKPGRSDDLAGAENDGPLPTPEMRHGKESGLSVPGKGPVAEAETGEVAVATAWWTAHRISTAVSLLLHATLFCILAAIVTAATSTGNARVLDATFTEEEAEGGALDYGNSEIELDLSAVPSSSLHTMVSAVTMPLTVIPEASVAVPSLPDAELPPTDAVESGKRGSGSKQGRNGSAAGPGSSVSEGRKRASFFGSEVKAGSIAFVIDASKSMTGTRFQRARMELAYSLSQLEPDQRFFVVFYTDQTYPMFFPDNTIELIQANKENIQKVLHWMEQTQAQGGTQPQFAMAMTLKLRPDAVFFLSDGNIPFDTAGVVRRSNAGSAIHTITFGSDAGASIMHRIAVMNGGKYRFIPDGF